MPSSWVTGQVVLARFGVLALPGCVLHIAGKGEQRVGVRSENSKKI
ncbi:hypothetical protein HMPREF0742_02471 [Rothia aeria F0184]|uniref:Uncharacterized protein n=1 Tax=Rothia aeria F0184 TaxID=888019 RepID=U7UXQ9_9MICC|nr:hypothetical protein HMPREF0742_02471 [Rothia aeria F0184]